MTTIVLTKEFIIKAIKEEEHLRVGLFVASNSYRASIEVAEEDGDCYVCAVGAVLKRALDPHQKLMNIDRAATAATGGGDVVPIFVDDADYGYKPNAHLDVHDDESVFALVDKTLDKPMRALSLLYEGLSHYNNKDVAIKKVLHYIAEKFPDRMLVDINGAEPAEDVEVV